MRKTKLIKAVETKYKRPLREVLHQLYAEEGYTMNQAGEILGVHASTIYYWMLKLGMPTRQFMLPGETKSKQGGME
jgi:transposase